MPSSGYLRGEGAAEGHPGDQRSAGLEARRRTELAYGLEGLSIKR